jgi:guanosine-3',5'-bis(diphosphate) 3'-pyrophosphohydrolase
VVRRCVNWYIRQDAANDHPAAGGIVSTLELQIEDRNKTTLEHASGNTLLHDLLQTALKVRSTHNLTLIADAYKFAEHTFRDTKRRSGKPLLEHAVAVARILVNTNLGSTTIAAGMTHEAVEKGKALPALREEFGDEVANLVEGVDKLKDCTFQAPKEELAEQYRKTLIALAEDIRVVLIKFADRLHNMRFLDELDEETRNRMSLESRDIYAPLAHRLGLARIRWELEDLSLKALDPDQYAAIKEKIYLRRNERESLIEEVRAPITEAIRNAGITAALSGRPKNFYSVHKKMVRRGISFEEIYDLMALRIIVESVQDCYTVLGIVHSSYTPVMARFKDFIATPKSNMYQSLHTTIISPSNVMMEVQIRTQEMHQTSEVGIAAHWRYKEGANKPSDLDTHMPWLRSLLEWESETQDAEEFIEDLKFDLFPDEIYVLTPNGDPVRLPFGATPIDFAFSIHTDLGLHCSEARVDGRIAPLDAALQTGNRVEVIPSPDVVPAPNWLHIARSRKARTNIRRWFREQEEAALGFPQDVDLRIEASNRDNLLSDLAAAISDLGISIITAELSTVEDQAINRFTIRVKSAHAMQQLTPRVREIPGVLAADVYHTDNK